MKRYYSKWNKIFVLLLVLVGGLSPIHAQLNEYSQKVLELDKHFEEIRQAKKGDMSHTGYKHYVQWKKFTLPRLDDEGTLNSYAKAMVNLQHSQGSRSAGISYGQWNFLGPKNGLPTHLSGMKHANGKGQAKSICIIEEINYNSIYIGTHRGGLWLSEDEGQTWDCLTDHRRDINGVRNIVVDPNNHNTIYILTAMGDGGSGFVYSSGVYKSIDKGQTWTHLNSGSSLVTGQYKYRPRKLLIDPLNSNNVYMLNHNRVYKSSNAGATWSKIYEESPLRNIGGQTGLWDMEFITENSIQYLIVSGHRIYKTNNDFASYTDITSVLTNILATNISGYTAQPELMRVGLCRDAINHPNYMWFYLDYDGSAKGAVVRYNVNGTYTFLYHETNSHIAMDPSSTMMILEVSPNDKDLIYVGGRELSKHYAGNTNSKSLCTVWSANTLSDFIHMDMREVAILKDNGKDVVYVANDGGLSKSDPEFPSSTAGYYTWTDLSAQLNCELNITEFYGFDWYTGGGDILVGGCQDLSSFYYNNGIWYHFDVGDGGQALIDHGKPDHFFLTTSYGAHRYEANSSGVTKQRLIINTRGDDHKLVLKQDPRDSKRIYISENGGGSTQRLYRVETTNPDWIGTLTSTDISPVVTSGNDGFSDIGMSAAASNVLYCSRTNTANGVISELFKSMDYGNTWTDITSNFPDPGRLSDYNSFIHVIEVDPCNENKLWIGLSKFGKGDKYVYESSDGGQTWTKMGLNYPQDFAVNDLVYDDRNDAMYAATDAGVFVWDFNNAGLGWIDFSRCMPKGIVTKLRINNFQGKIRAATLGFGIWESNLHFCPDDLNNYTYIGETPTSKLKSTQGWIQTSENVSVPQNYRSSQSVKMLPGFKSGTSFRAQARLLSCPNNCEEDNCYPGLRSEIALSTTNSKDAEKEKNISFYPNPANDKVYFKDYMNLRLYTVNGELIQSLNESNVLDVSNLANGVYILKASGYGEQKIVVQH